MLSRATANGIAQRRLKLNYEIPNDSIVMVGSYDWKIEKTWLLLSHGITPIEVNNCLFGTCIIQVRPCLLGF